MARTRTIKHGFFTNDELGVLPPISRLLFAGLWTIADREGRLLDRPRKIRAEILPYDDFDVDQAIEELATHGFLLRYKVDGVACIQILNWLKHQRPHPREEQSQLPAPPAQVESSLPGPEPDLGAAEPDLGVARGKALPGLTSSSSSSFPSGESGGACTAPHGATPRRSRNSESIPKPNRSAEVIDAIRKRGVEPTLTKRDHAALRDTSAKAELIAEVYGAVYSGDYGDEFMQRHLCVREAIGWIDGYLALKNNGPPRTGRNGTGTHHVAIDRTGRAN